MSKTNKIEVANESEARETSQLGDEQLQDAVAGCPSCNLSLNFEEIKFDYNPNSR